LVDETECLEVAAAIDEVLADPSEKMAPLRISRMRAWPEPLKIAYLPHGWRLTFEIAGDKAGEQLLAARSLLRLI
jgi:hypothetical protein